MPIILSNDFFTITDAMITAKTADASYPKVNITDYWHLKRRYRATGVTESDTDYIMKFNFGEAKSLAALFLNDVNFDKVRIYGHASDLNTDWSTASYNSGTVSISLDTITNRYKLFHALTSFNYRYMAIGVPVAGAPVGSYTTKWEIGSIVCMETATELSKNMSYGYERSADASVVDIDIAGGSRERAVLGEDLIWQGSLKFGIRAIANESDLWTLNRMAKGDPMVFYENDGNTQNAWLCVRDNAMSVTRPTYGAVSGNAIVLRELV